MVEYDPQAEARMQRFLASWADRHSSLVSAQWPGCLVLEVRASLRLLGPWPRIEARLREELGRLGFQRPIKWKISAQSAQLNQARATAFWKVDHRGKINLLRPRAAE